MDAQLQQSPVESLDPSIAQVHRDALLTDPAELTDAPGHARTVTHVFEPVRDAHGVLVDFRLQVDAATAHDATRGFAGIQLNATGEWAAPGAAFYMLKQVFESGEPARSITRHVGKGFELQCRQAAVRHGDAVVTTTTIFTHLPPI